jgi:hypothetical protein
MRNIFFIGLLTISIPSYSQVMTIITTLNNGLRDTVKFGFVPDATLDEDISLGEMNVFTTPVNGYEGRILQRDSSNFSCAVQHDNSKVYYSDNFDSKFNYRNPSDTSLQNRLFEIWYSDNQTDSLEFICDIPFKSFLLSGVQYPFDCFGDPPSPGGLLVIQDDTLKHIKAKITQGLGVRQYIFITKPDITLTAVDENALQGNKTDFNVYPNPSSGIFYFQYPSAHEIRKIYIYDSIGKENEYYETIPNILKLDLSQYSSGTYIAVFVLGNGDHIIKRIIKQ